MDLELLEQVVAELDAELRGAKADKVVQCGDGALILVLHGSGRDRYLLLAAVRSLPRIHLVSRKPAGTTSPGGFSLFLRKHLTGGRVAEVRVVNRDRVVEIRFTRLTETRRLILELTGSAANLLLTDDAQKILAVLHPVPPDSRASRPLLPGLAYRPPEHFQRQRRTTGGIVSPDQIAGRRDSPVNAAVEAWYDHAIREREDASLRRRLASVLRKASARAERRHGAIAADAARAERGEEYRIAGELILANKHLLRKGQEQAELSGHDGRTASVALDPSSSPAENAARYFQRYKKAKAGLALAQDRLAGSRDEMTRLKDLREELDAATNRQGLYAVRHKLSREGYIREAEGSAPAIGGRAAPPFRTVEHEGWRILIGKSAAGNDYLTREIARPDDLWLHAEGMPGSHVLVRNPGKRDVPDGVLRKAASLAAYYSKGKGAAKVPVAYTKASFVKKPKGAAPGTVVLTSRRTLLAVPAPE